MAAKAECWSRDQADSAAQLRTRDPATPSNPAHTHQHSTHRTLALPANKRYFPVANTVSPPMDAVSPSLSSGNPVRGPAVRPLWLAWSRAAPGCHTPFNGDTAQLCVLGTRGTVQLSTLPQPSSIICLAPPPTSPEPRLLPATGPVLIHLCDVPHNTDTMLYTGCCRLSGKSYRSINRNF